MCIFCFYVKDCLFSFMSVSIHILKLIFPSGKGVETINNGFTLDVLLVELVVCINNIKPELASWLFVYYTPFLFYVHKYFSNGMSPLLHMGHTLDRQ